MKKLKSINGLTVSVYAKCSDLCNTRLFKGTKIVTEKDGYVPEFLSKDSDAIVLKIDLATGQILNWKPPTVKDIEEFINDEEELDSFDYEGFDKLTSLPSTTFILTLCKECSLLDPTLPQPYEYDKVAYCEGCGEIKKCGKYEKPK